jgi:ribonuclease E
MRAESAPRSAPQSFARSESAPSFEDLPTRDGAASASDSLAPPSGGSDASPRPKRRRGSRGGRRRRSRGGAPRDDAPRDDAPRDDAHEDEPQDSDPSLERPLESEPEGSAPSETSDAPSDRGVDEPGRGRRGRRRRGKRGGQRGPRQPAGASNDGRMDSGTETHGASEARGEVVDSRDREPSGAAVTLDAGADARPKRRRRGGRGGRGRRRETAQPIRETAQPVEVEWIPGEENDLPELPELPDDAEVIGESVLDAPAQEGTRGSSRKKSRRREKGSREPVSRSVETEPAIEPARKTLILVNAADPEEQRVAVVEGETIIDFQMTVKSQNSVVNDIYRGRVVNLEPAIGAAFVDFGQGRNGFLHTSDVISAYGEKDWSIDKLLTTNVDPSDMEEWDSDATAQPTVADEILDVDSHDEGADVATESTKRRQKSRSDHARRFRARPRLPITDLLRKGETVVVQVTKDAIGDKGPTLTTYISIPGRYLVLMPCMSRTGVSRKIEDEKERRRLKKILQQLEVPPSMGVIVRTAGIGRSKADLKRDLDYLKGVWESFSTRLKAGHGPAPLYQESDIAIRTVRDLFTPETEAVVVDDPEVHRQIVDFTRQLMPENVERVKLYTGPRPVFHSYGVESDFEKIFARRIELAAGGSIVFDQAEALVAIDVNSGRTRTDGFDFEDIALKANLAAAPEIARQIRLRDLGGIIVVDFIDMMRAANIRTVERVFKEALAGDRARSKLGRISQFGLLELTRQRLGPGMNKKVFHTCPRCRGTGRVRTVESRAAAILRRLGSAMSLKGFSTVEVRAHPEVVAYLKDYCTDFLRALEYRFEREIKLFDAPEQAEDSVLRYVRTDGREVRPGGRRKR